MSRRYKQSEPNPMPSYQAYRNKGPWLSREQAKYYAWFEALMPWMDVIKSIQSDYS